MERQAAYDQCALLNKYFRAFLIIRRLKIFPIPGLGNEKQPLQ